MIGLFVGPCLLVKLTCSGAPQGVNLKVDDSLPRPGNLRILRRCVWGQVNDFIRSLRYCLSTKTEPGSSEGSGRLGYNSLMSILDNLLPVSLMDGSTTLLVSAASICVRGKMGVCAILVKIPGEGGPVDELPLEGGSGDALSIEEGSDDALSIEEGSDDAM